MKAKKDRTVSFDPTVDISVFINNVIGNNRNKVPKGSKEFEVIKTIGNAFANYLSSVQQLDARDRTTHYPLLKKDKKGKTIASEIDKRIVMFYALLVHLATRDMKNRHNLPAKFNGHDLDFTTKGWPVVTYANGVNDPHLLKWQEFINTAAQAFLTVLPEANLKAWMDESILQVAASDELVPYNFDNWHAPRELNILIQRIKEMHRYGQRLKDNAPEKSEVVVSLAIKLHNDLKNHYVSNLHLTRDAHKDFEFNFKQTLHSQDDLMNEHRKYWTVVVANIALALTVVGAVAVGISLLVRGHGFFNETISQRMVTDLHKETNQCIPVK